MQQARWGGLQLDEVFDEVVVRGGCGSGGDVLVDVGDCC